MPKTILPLFAAALVLPGVAFAQSTVTLDSFSLGDPPKPDAAAAEMRDCLVDPSACDNAEFGGGAKFTLDDVVNLGVVERKPKPPASATPARAGVAIAIEDRTKKPEPLPTIDLEVLFAYDSDALTPQAMAKLSTLANALSDPRLKDSKLIFIGHTDAVGARPTTRRCRSAGPMPSRAMSRAPCAWAPARSRRWAWALTISRTRARRMPPRTAVFSWCWCPAPDQPGDLPKTRGRTAPFLLRGWAEGGKTAGFWPGQNFTV
ncbi:hypothetical protein KU6B_40930 [Mameliella alba]|uniref:OmpA family protein n=1 Tax=Mameliella alba TaxID=561184 RepID=UPI0013E48773|nr:hypothetical protein [Mameliella alba]BBU57828.1 hypothetical protein KU6B_40930 [Mameliella alba]